MTLNQFIKKLEKLAEEDGAGESLVWVWEHDGLGVFEVEEAGVLDLYGEKKVVVLS